MQESRRDVMEAWMRVSAVVDERGGLVRTMFFKWKKAVFVTWFT